MRLYITLWNMNEICMYNNDNKHFGEIEKKHQINIAVNDLCNTMDHSPQCWSEVFFFIYLNVIIIRFSYIYVSQGSVKTHLWCGGIYNNHIIANCPQSVSVKELWLKFDCWQNFTWTMHHLLAIKMPLKSIYTNNSYSGFCEVTSKCEVSSIRQRLFCTDSSTACWEISR